jgi:tRNA(fMet)-specific endonuclease VapC
MKSSKSDQNQIALSQFVAPLEILPYGDDAAQFYGSIRAYLEKQGTPLGSLDMLIAAHALSINGTLVTNNEKEFSRVPDLRIENWIS